MAMLRVIYQNKELFFVWRTVKRCLYGGGFLFMAVFFSDGVLAMEDTVIVDATQPTLTVHESEQRTQMIDLHVCRDERLGVKFLCNPDWELKTDEGAIFVVISQDPQVTLTIAKSDSADIVMDHLTRSVLLELGEYADDFQSKRIKLNEYDAIRVDAISRDFPDMRLLDYYLLHDMSLVSILFSVKPQSRWVDYAQLMDGVLKSFEFLDVP
jgi:hypothetical protein